MQGRADTLGQVRLCDCASLAILCLLAGLVDEATPGKAVALHSLIQGIVTHDLLQVRRQVKNGNVVLLVFEGAGAGD